MVLNGRTASEVGHSGVASNLGGNVILDLHKLICDTCEKSGRCPYVYSKVWMLLILIKEYYAKIAAVNLKIVLSPALKTQVF